MSTFSSSSFYSTGNISVLYHYKFNISGLLVEQNKQFKDATLDSGELNNELNNK